MLGLGSKHLVMVERFSDNHYLAMDIGIDL